MISPHPLQGAFDRVDRAAEHLAEFKAEQAKFGQAYHDNLILKPNLQPPPDFSTHEGVPVIPSARSAILLGEVIYNFRAALDYLIFELAFLDSGTVQTGTQFPICDAIEGFNRVAPKFLVGLNSSHRAAIEQLQPYNGCNWAAVLREISNPDKHRQLVRDGYAFRIQATNFPNSSMRGLNAPVIRSQRRAIRSAGEEVDVYLATEAPIMINAPLPKGGWKMLPVKILTDKIELGVRDTLEAFKPEF